MTSHHRRRPERRGLSIGSQPLHKLAVAPTVNAYSRPSVAYEAESSEYFYENVVYLDDVDDS